jgi:hypothetical protein
MFGTRSQVKTQTQTQTQTQTGQSDTRKMQEVNKIVRKVEELIGVNAGVKGRLEEDQPGMASLILVNLEHDVNSNESDERYLQVIRILCNKGIGGKQIKEKPSCFGESDTVITFNLDKKDSILEALRLMMRISKGPGR